MVIRDRSERKRPKGVPPNFAVGCARCDSNSCTIGCCCCVHERVDNELLYDESANTVHGSAIHSGPAAVRQHSADAACRVTTCRLVRSLHGDIRQTTQSTARPLSHRDSGLEGWLQLTLTTRLSTGNCRAETRDISPAGGRKALV